MATRTLLAEILRAFEARAQREVALSSMGGIDVEARVRAGEPFDVVVLADEAISRLLASGHLQPNKANLARSGVAVAVRAGAARPDITSEAALERAVLAASTIGHSTGPSGSELAKLFARWGILERIRNRIVVAPPGVPVAALVARGEVELGFQQLSELLGVAGVDVIGPLPPAAQIVTTFSAAVAATSLCAESARDLLTFLASPATQAMKRRHGMEPA